MSKVTLGYWDGRGRAQVARHLLFYSGVQSWEQVKYKKGEDWFKRDKVQLGLPLPNLPYLIEGDFKLTESYAIYKYIAKHFGKKQLVGKTIQDQALVDCMMGSIYDIDHTLVALCWDPQGKSKLQKALQTVIPKLKSIGNIYGQKQYAIGYLTIIDFLVSQFSFYLQKMSGQHYKQLSFLQKTRNAIENLPKIKQYYGKQFAVKGPFVETGDFAF